MSLEKELIAARARLVSQRSACQETEVAFAVAVERKLISTQRALNGKLTRQRDAVCQTAAIVGELEAALAPPAQVDLVEAVQAAPRKR